MRIKSQKPAQARGFTLVEVLIVLAILTVLAVVAVPQFTGMRRAYRERTVVRYLQQVGVGANAYKTTSGLKSYPEKLYVLYTKQPGQQQPLIPELDVTESSMSGFVAGWHITWDAAGANSFQCTATPTDTANQKRLAVFEDGVVRQTNDGSTPTRTSPEAK